MIRYPLLAAGVLFSVGLLGAGGPQEPVVEVAAVVCFLTAGKTVYRVQAPVSGYALYPPLVK